MLFIVVMHLAKGKVKCVLILKMEEDRWFLSVSASHTLIFSDMKHRPASITTSPMDDMLDSQRS